MTPIFEDVLRSLIVGTDIASTRVFLMRAPQAPADQLKTPYVVFIPVGPSPVYSHRGQLSMQDTEYQISIFDASQSRALAARDTLRSKLGGIRGVYAGVNIGGMFYRSDKVAYESASDLHHVIVTFRIQFEFLPEFGNFTIHPRKPNATERRITQ